MEATVVMDLKTVLSVLDGETVSRQTGMEQPVMGGAAADLMSDVLAYARPDSVLLTGLLNPQVVRTAEMAGIRAIVFVRGKHPPAETVNLAKEIGIPLFSTRYTMYEACGRLYQAGLPGPGPCDSYDLPEQAAE
jgi:predicted transcriptional regulator